MTGAEAAPSPQSIAVTVGSANATTSKGGFTIKQDPTATGRTHVTISSASGSLATTVAPGSIVKAVFGYGESAHDGTRAGSAEVSVTPPDDSTADPAAVVRAYKASCRSVITDAMETGLSYEQAMSQFGDMDPASNPSKEAAERVVAAESGASLTGRASRTTQRVSLAPATASTASTSPTVAAWATATAYDSWCTDVSANGGDQTAHGCIIRYLDYSSGGLRYWTHKQKVTAKDDSFWMVMSSTTQRYIAPTGNSVVDWDPWQTQSTGDCRTFTLGATDPKTGVSASYSGTVCPDKFGPSFSDSNRGYGSYWGGTSNDYVGAHSISVVKTSPGYSSNGTLKVAMTWRARASRSGRVSSDCPSLT
ncbi:MAG TPA: hypothetical protein VFJ97_08970 [Dermatophilaceae bacterium]|nr:hypothetical protein [Dermatophilaceae bacterium]